MAAFPVDYELPTHRIAQEPIEPRDHARLLVIHRGDVSLEHRHFYDLPQLLKPGDLLILNNTRVLPARLIGKRAATGGKWEGLFLRECADGTWELLCQTRGRLEPGERIDVEPGPLVLELTAKLPEGRWQARPLAHGSAMNLLQQHGRMPLPPYIRKGLARAEDRERYQTVFGREPGAVAAPTAGLHFTESLFDRLRERGIDRAFVTLHVGLGTFRPIEAEDYPRHTMHREWGQLLAPAVHAIHACRQRGGKVVAVGTTTVRVLETAARLGPRQTWAGETDLFIHPPYEFRAVDALITNFHLPRTTLLLLVAAFAGIELTRKAYGAAIAAAYRFYSYGDAMLILP
jgi:S-adenosylmethionine:tRNA ribosyltransferase-isomerase